MSHVLPNPENSFDMWNVSDLLDDNNDNIQEPQDIQQDVDLMVCKVCNGKMKRLKEYNMVCSDCGSCMPIHAGESSTIYTEGTYNVSSNSHVNYKIVGTRNRIYQQTLIRYTGEGIAYRNAKILQSLKNLNFNNVDFKIPLDVLKLSCEMFIALREHDYVRRGKTRRGVLGACIYVNCIKAGITKTKTQIAKMMVVEENKITYGLDELRYYANLGIIEIPYNWDPIPDFIATYFEVLGIDKKWHQFAVDLIHRFEKKRLFEISNCFNTTKCIGVCYLLTKCLGMPLNKTVISEKCDNISRNTYLSVSNKIEKNEKALRKPFIRHKVPLPPSWLKKKDKK